MTVRIGPIDYEMELIEELQTEDGESADGWICYADGAIRLDAALHPQLRRVTLWHEILHAILTQTGRQRHNEGELDALAHGIVQVLRDNPDLGELAI
jgi:hypothetical protein